MSQLLNNETKLFKDYNTTYQNTFQNSSCAILTYWNKVIQQDLQQNPSKKRQYQLQQYLLQTNKSNQYNQENEMP